ncbi:hypothetical protein ACS0TY_014738 [Phlomoides rotata]
MSDHTHKMIHIFYVENYNIWKFRMEAHLGSIRDEMWEVIETGPIVIFHTNTVLGGDPNQPLVRWFRSQAEISMQKIGSEQILIMLRRTFCNNLLMMLI